VTHNQSEQRRARRINTYIEDLKQLLSASGRLGDKTDKGSTLEAAVVFISDALEAGDGGVSTPSAAAARPRSLPDPASGGAAVDYRRLFERSGVAQAIAGMDGSILDCNQRFTDISGYSRDEIRTRSIFNMTPAADLQRTFEIVSEMMEPSQQPSGEQRRRRAPRAPLREPERFSRPPRPALSFRRCPISAWHVPLEAGWLVASALAPAQRAASRQSSSASSARCAAASPRSTSP